MSILNLRWGKKKPAPVPVPPPVVNGVIRVTDERDGEILNRGYSFWSQSIREADGSILAFAGNADGLTRFFRVRPDGTVLRLGALIGYTGTGEGWSFNSHGDVYLCEGPRLRRVNPITGTDVVVLDISATHPGCDIWQAHSSGDGLTHSATVRTISDTGSYPKIGTVIQCASGRMFYAATGTLDESQLTADGSYIIIKETDDEGRLYNRIVSCLGGGDGYRLNPGEAIGHSDCGPDFIVGEDSQIGACVRFDPRTREKRSLFSTWNLGHLSVRAGKCLLSDAEKLSLVALDGSGITALEAHGMVSDGTYDTQVFGSLSPDGTVAAWVSNLYGRNDLFVLSVP
jgi:hypothetical protein